MHNRDWARFFFVTVLSCSRCWTLWAATLIAVQPAAAQTTSIWNGGDGDWHDGNNWSTSPVVPQGAEFNVVIDNDATIDSNVDVLLNKITIGSLRVDAGDSLTLSERTQLNLISDQTINPSSGVIHNNGRIVVADGSSSGGEIVLHAEVHLQGTGIIELPLYGSKSYGQSRIVAGGFGTHLFNHGNTIRGVGRFGYPSEPERNFDITNGPSGIIESAVNPANGSFIDPALNIYMVNRTLTNQGLVRSSPGSYLIAQAETINNVGGTIESLDDSVVSLHATRLDGGNLISHGTGQIKIHGQLSNVKIQGALTVNQASIGGSILNMGEINGVFDVAQSATLTGGGVVSWEYFPWESIGSADGSPAVLTNVDNILQGAAIVGDGSLHIINQAGGMIHANDIGGDPLVIQPRSGTPMLNQGTLWASGNGVLRLGAGEFDNRDGTIELTDGGTMSHRDYYGGGAVVRGGIVESDGTGRITGKNLKLVDTTLVGSLITGGGSIGAPVFTGTIRNLGTVHNESFGIDGTTTITGGGSFELARFFGASESSVLINLDNRIRGSGDFGSDKLQIINERAGLIESDDRRYSILMDPRDDVASINRGTIRAINGSTFSVRDGILDNRAGLITVSTGSRLSLEDNGVIDNTGNVIQLSDSSSALLKTGGTIRGGSIVATGGSRIVLDQGAKVVDATLRAEDAGTIELTPGSLNTSPILQNATLDGRIEVPEIYLIEVSGTLRNRSSLAVDVAGVILLDSDVTVTGGGEFVSPYGSLGQINPRFGGNEATLIHADHTIRGSWYIGPVTVDDQFTFINEAGGILDANVNQMSINATEDIINRGLFTVADGAILQISRSDVHNYGDIQVDFGGRMKLKDQLINMDSGRLTGSGRISSEATIVNQGVIDPGTIDPGTIDPGTIDPGVAASTLELAAVVTFTSTSQLDIDIDAGVSDLLTVFGALTLDGDLVIDVASGFTPLETDTYQIVKVLAPIQSPELQGSLNGQFAGISDGSRLWTEDGLGSFVVEYRSDGVYLRNYLAVIPEPGSFLMLGLAAAIAMTRRRRLHAS